MQQETKLKYLKICLYGFGVFFILGTPAMMVLFGNPGFTWMPAQPEYELMIVGLYMTWGIFLVRAAKDPMANTSLIGFTIWGNIVHSGIMLAEAIVDKTEHANMVGDIPGLFLVGVVLWYLMPKSDSTHYSAE